MYNSFGQRLRAARNAKNLSRTELADLIGYSSHTVKAWELNRHQPTKQVIKKLELLLACSLAPCDLGHIDATLANVREAILSLPKDKKTAAILMLENLAKSYR